MEEIKHTPLPWHLDDNFKGESPHRLILFGCGHRVALCYKEGVTGYPDETEAKANAEFIVTAVNSYYQLQAGLVKAKEALIMASLIDKTNTCDKAVKEIETLLSTLNEEKKV